MLNNFLVAATVLTAHIRTCAKRQPDNGALDKQRSDKADVVFATDEAQFAKAARRYTHHDGSPLLCVHFDGCADGPREAFTSIDTDMLKQCDALSADARSYISTQGRYVIVGEFASAYFEACAEYCQWFTGERYTANKKELDAFSQTMNRIKRIQAGARIEEGPSIT